MASVRAKLAAKKLAENGGKSVSGAMIAAGYSPQTAKSPSKLTKSKSWAELMEEYLPDSFLAEKHQALLNKRNKEGLIDGDAVARGLDLAYKLKGKFKPVQIDIRSFTGWTPQELDDYAANGVIPERFVDAGESES